jgi:prolipoprotein diacylglyceryltransferase
MCLGHVTSRTAAICRRIAVSRFTTESTRSVYLGGIAIARETKMSDWVAVPMMIASACGLAVFVLAMAEAW